MAMSEQGGQDSRRAVRSAVRKLELVTVYRDRLDEGYEESIGRLANHPNVYTIFSVVAALRDVSSGGVSLTFKGQQLMASNILEPGQRYLLKLTMAEADEDVAQLGSYLRRESNYSYVLVKAICRWYQPSHETSAAGFQLTGSNPPEVSKFVRRHFKLEDS